MLKNITAFIVTVAILFPVTTLFCHADANVSLSAQSAILIDADSGIILYEKNSRERMGMASTTKIMTALTVIRLTDIKNTVVVPRAATGIEGSSIYLCEGEKLTVEELLYGLLLSSANDAATALAIFCSGSVEAFCAEMNKYAAELGACETNFVNPHGLDSDDHYTTAYDLSLISREALKDPTLKEIFSTYKKYLPMNGQKNGRLAVNHNKMLKSYDGAIGMKTGFTKATGRCLVSAAERQGLTLICVTLNAPDDWRDHTTLLDLGYDNFERRLIADTGGFEYEFPITGGETDNVTLFNTIPIALTLRKGNSDVKCVVESPYRFIYAPAKASDVPATVTVSCEGQSISSPLAVKNGVDKKKVKKGLWKNSQTRLRIENGFGKITKILYRLRSDVKAGR